MLTGKWTKPKSTVDQECPGNTCESRGCCSRQWGGPLSRRSNGEEGVAAARSPDAKDALDVREEMQTASPSEHGGNHGGPALGDRCFALQHVVQRGPVVVGLGSH